jgi:hypothetical protein
VTNGNLPTANGSLATELLVRQRCAHSSQDQHDFQELFVHDCLSKNTQGDRMCEKPITDWFENHDIVARALQHESQDSQPSVFCQLNITALALMVATWVILKQKFVSLLSTKRI